MELNKKKCIPCEGGVPKLNSEEIKSYMEQVDKAWEVEQDEKINRTFTFPNYIQTMAFVNKVADLSEDEGHHPDLHVYYGKVNVVFWTHAVDGLTENDFILAAKIDEMT